MADGIRLVSTDFDGTLIGHPSDGRCVPVLALELADFKAAGGDWVINTGRSLEHALEGVALFAAPVEPDYLITNERELYRRDEAGAWVDFGDWNERCRFQLAELFLHAEPIFRRVREMVAGSGDVTLIPTADAPEGLITTDESVMERVVGFLEEVARDVTGFSYQRNTVYLRFAHADYSKGTALAELRRLLGLAREETFAAGDHFNDLSMLDGRVAAWVGCPANAIPEAKQLVRAAGGTVATENFGAGTAAALAAAREGSRIKKTASA